jgi:hypothetical protein
MRMWCLDLWFGISNKVQLRGALNAKRKFCNERLWTNGKEMGVTTESWGATAFDTVSIGKNMGVN